MITYRRRNDLDTENFLPRGSIRMITAIRLLRNFSTKRLFDAISQEKHQHRQWLRAFLPTFSAPAWRKFFHLRKVRDLFEKKCSRARGAQIVALTICINSEWAWRAAEKRLIISDSAFGNSLRSGCEINKKADWVIQICLISFEAVARHEQLKCVTMLSWYLKPSPRGKKLA